MKSIRLTVFIASFLWNSVFGLQQTVDWGFGFNPYWQVSDTGAFKWSDTTIVSSAGDSSKGVYSSTVRVGDSSYLSEDLRNYNFSLSSAPAFHFTAYFQIERLDLYSALFMGVSDGSNETPYGNSGSTAIMVGLGRVYEGAFFGLYASDGVQYFSKDSVNQVTDLLEEGRKYVVRCSTEASFIAARLHRVSDGYLLAAVKVPFNPSDYNGLNHFALTIKGYQGTYGAGYATLKGALDSLSFTGTFFQSTNVQSPQTFRGSPGISAWPNPFRGATRLRIHGDLAANNQKLKIYDWAGKGVAELNAASLECLWRTEHLAPGIYIARITLRGTAYSKALILLR